MTGIKNRVVSNEDGTISYESRSKQDVPLELLNIAEKKRFMDGEKVRPAIANNPPEVSNSGALDLSIADHKMIFVTYKMKIKNPGFLIKRVRNYKGLNEKSLQKDLQDVPWWVTSLFDDIDDVT